MREIDAIVPESADRADRAAFSSVESALRFCFGNRYRGEPDSLAKHQKRIGARDERFEDSEERAAWAGDILRRIGPLGEERIAILVLKYAPRGFPCACRRPCCSGWQKNELWEEAFGTIVGRYDFETGTAVQRQLRAGILRRWVGTDRINIGILADKAGVHRNTAGKHAKAMRVWLDKLHREALDAADLNLRP